MISLTKILLFFLGGILISGLFTPVYAQELPLEQCERWWAPTGQKTRAVIVVTHGLNLRPDRMDEIAKAYSKEGYLVYRPAFTGHCGDPQKYFQVQYEQWDSDAKRIYFTAYRRAQSLHVPLHLLAYSFSGLIFQSKAEEYNFKNRIYIAPALATKFWYPFTVWFAKLFPGMHIKTVNLPTYAANEDSGLRSLLAMDVFYQRWQNGAGRKKQISAQVWMNKGDELLSFSDTEKLAKQEGWDFHEVKNDKATLPHPANHLIINEESMGQEQWQRFLSSSLQFLSK